MPVVEQVTFSGTSGGLFFLAIEAHRICNVAQFVRLSPL